MSKVKNQYKSILRKLNKYCNFFLAYYRYYMIKNKYSKKLIRKHIIEQFNTRYNSINTTCREKKKCVECGCKMPVYLLSNESCLDDCYPEMISSSDWKYLLEDESHIIVVDDFSIGSNPIEWKVIKLNNDNYKFSKTIVNYIIGADPAKIISDSVGLCVIYKKKKSNEGLLYLNNTNFNPDPINPIIHFDNAHSISDIFKLLNLKNESTK